MEWRQENQCTLATPTSKPSRTRRTLLPRSSNSKSQRSRSTTAVLRCRWRPTQMGSKCPQLGRLRKTSTHSETREDRRLSPWMCSPRLSCQPTGSRSRPTTRWQMLQLRLLTSRSLCWSRDRTTKLPTTTKVNPWNSRSLADSSSSTKGRTMDS